MFTSIPPKPRPGAPYHNNGFLVSVTDPSDHPSGWMGRETAQELPDIMDLRGQCDNRLPTH